MDLWAEGGRAVITANEDAADAIKLHADAGTSQTITIVNDAGTSVTEGSSAIELLSTDGGVELKSEANLAKSIKLIADGGSSETIFIQSDQGTGAGSITLTSDVGGIKIVAGLDIIIDADGGDISFKDKETNELKFTNVSGQWTIANQTSAKQIDLSSPYGITMDAYAISLQEHYELHIGSASVNNFYTHGEADLKQNYSMLSYQYESSAGTFEASY